MIQQQPGEINIQRVVLNQVPDPQAKGREQNIVDQTVGQGCIKRKFVKEIENRKMTCTNHNPDQSIKSADRFLEQWVAHGKYIFL